MKNILADISRRRRVIWTRLKSREPRALIAVSALGSVVIVAAIILFRVLWGGADIHVVLQPPGNERGSKNAPVKIIEYASLGCQECARFDEDIFPEVFTDYINRGRVYFIFRAVSLDDATLDAAALARCARQDDYFAFVDLVMRRQNSWTNASDPEKVLLQLASATGMPVLRAQLCIRDSYVLQPIQDTAQKASTTYPLDNLPAFVINGTVLSGPQTWKNFRKAVEEKLAAHS